MGEKEKYHEEDPKEKKIYKEIKGKKGCDCGDVIVQVYVKWKENSDPKIEIYTFNINAPVDDILIAKDGAVNSYKPHDTSAIITGNHNTQSAITSGEEEQDQNTDSLNDHNVKEDDDS